MNICFSFGALTIKMIKTVLYMSFSGTAGPQNKFSFHIPPSKTPRIFVQSYFPSMYSYQQCMGAPAALQCSPTFGMVTLLTGAISMGMQWYLFVV